MKKIFVLPFVFATTAFLYAQVPQALNYQGVVHNSSGSILPNQLVNARFSIHDGSPAATIVYQETDTATTNQFGSFAILIGNGAVTIGSFNGINWATGNKYLEVDLDPNGGNDYNNMGTSQLVSVPYALYAQTSGTGGFTHYIGQLYGGGIVVSVWKDTTGTEHGLVASLMDLSAGTVWSNLDTSLIGPPAETLLNGRANTTAIINQSGATSGAAFLCHNYAGGGYTDWYLPAIMQLQQCYNAYPIVNTILGNTNGINFNAYYWSSTEFGNANAYAVAFGYGYLGGNGNKSSTYSVRAVRSY